MIDHKIVDDLARRAAEAAPAGMGELQKDLEKNLRAGLSGLFSRLELVSREEFDIQSAVLARTRSKLDALEKQLAELEDSLRDKSKPS